MKIGLLGGSFNPAHAGHLHLSLEAIKTLNLDEVWWLVSPQNPLKSADNMTDFEERFTQAQEFTKNIIHLKVLDLEAQLKTQYSCDIISAIQKQFTEHQFIWLMGADNLQIFHKWRNWQDIFNIIPIAVFDRNPYSYSSLAGNAPIFFAKYREITPKNLINNKPPTWSFIRINKKDISSSQIRSKHCC